MTSPDLTPDELAQEAAEVHRAVEIMRERQAEARAIRERAALEVARSKAARETRRIRAVALAKLNGGGLFVVALLAALAVAAPAAHAAARAVPLSAATAPPAEVDYLRAGEAAPVNNAAGPYPADVQAYRWNGAALAGQEWNGDHDRLVWRDPRGGRVVYDGVRVHNRTHGAILFALWYDRPPRHHAAAAVADSGRSLPEVGAIIGGLLLVTVGGSAVAAFAAERRAA